MAITLKTAGTWARNVSDPTGAITIPGSPASGNRMFLFAAWKDAAITVTDPSGWTPIGTPFKDGTVAAGNGTGSVKVAAWYRDWVTGDAGPSIDWSSAPTEAGVVVMLWQKGASDTWDTPSTVNAAYGGAAAAWSVTSSSTATVIDGSVVMELAAFRDDDGGTFTRSATTALAESGTAVVWNGNYVESPATNWSSTTGLDMCADLGHRFVTIGGTGVTLTGTGTLAAAETGAVMWVVQGLTATTTGTAKLSLASGSAPSVDTLHTIYSRARVTSDTGVLNLALYEGANNRSGTISRRLSTTLTDLAFPIPSASAANITDYSNLDVWVSGSANGPVVFEVDQIWVEAPQVDTVTGTFAATAPGAAS